MQQQQDPDETLYVARTASSMVWSNDYAGILAYSDNDPNHLLSSTNLAGERTCPFIVRITVVLVLVPRYMSTYCNAVTSLAKMLDLLARLNSDAGSHSTASALALMTYYWRLLKSSDAGSTADC